MNVSTSSLIPSKSISFRRWAAIKRSSMASLLLRTVSRSTMFRESAADTFLCLRLVLSRYVPYFHRSCRPLFSSVHYLCQSGICYPSYRDTPSSLWWSIKYRNIMHRLLSARSYRIIEFQRETSVYLHSKSVQNFQQPRLKPPFRG